MYALLTASYQMPLLLKANTTAHRKKRTNNNKEQNKKGKYREKENKNRSS